VLSRVITTYRHCSRSSRRDPAFRASVVHDRNAGGGGLGWRWRTQVRPEKQSRFCGLDRRAPADTQARLRRRAGDQTLGVVAENDGVALGRVIAHAFASSRSDAQRGAGLPIGAHDLLVVRDDARLSRVGRRRPRIQPVRRSRLRLARGRTDRQTGLCPPSRRTRRARRARAGCSRRCPRRERERMVLTATTEPSFGKMRVTEPQIHSSSIASPIIHDALLAHAPKYSGRPGK